MRKDEFNIMANIRIIEELKANAENINYEDARKREEEVRHDVMSHVYAYGKQCPNAEPIIHLGATSCYVGDNTDLIIMREASELVLKKAAQVLKNLSAAALNLVRKISQCTPLHSSVPPTLW